MTRGVNVKSDDRSSDLMADFKPAPLPLPVCIRRWDRLMPKGNRHWSNISDGPLNAPVMFN